VRGKWVRALYIGERQVIEQQYAEWEITGPPRFATSIPAPVIPTRVRPKVVTPCLRYRTFTHVTGPYTLI
jgi:hypothetical protein